MKHGVLTWLLAATVSIFWLMQSQQYVTPPEFSAAPPSDYFLRQTPDSFEDNANQSFSNRNYQSNPPWHHLNQAHSTWRLLGSVPLRGRLTDVEIQPDGTLVVIPKAGEIFRSVKAGSHWELLLLNAMSFPSR